jgi:predicted DNA-binding transcriptional regulator AlpA
MRVARVTSKPKLAGPSINIERRVLRTLEHFTLLPDDALIDIRELSILLHRSPSSIWRDLPKGLLPKPIKVGHSTRWRAGDARAVMKGGQ